MRRGRMRSRALGPVMKGMSQGSGVRGHGNALSPKNLNTYVVKSNEKITPKPGRERHLREGKFERAETEAHYTRRSRSAPPLPQLRPRAVLCRLVLSAETVPRMQPAARAARGRLLPWRAAPQFRRRRADRHHRRP